MNNLQLLQFKYNQHANNMLKTQPNTNTNKYLKHSIGKAEMIRLYQNMDDFQWLLALDKEYFAATERDFNNYIDWLVNGNKTR